MIKKLLISLLLLFMLGGNAFASDEVNVKDNAKASILEWSMFSKSQAWTPEHWKGKKLDCSREQIQSLISLNSLNEDDYSLQIDNLKKTDPGFVQDVKGCLTDGKVDSVLKWFIYLTIIAIIAHILYVLGIWFLGWGKWGGWDSMGMDPMWGWGWGSWEDIVGKIKAPLVALWIMFLIALWAINLFLSLISWIKDAVIG